MFVAIEEHDGQRVEKLVHCVEIWYLGDVNHVESHELAEFVGRLHNNFIHLHAGGIPIVSEANDH